MLIPSPRRSSWSRTTHSDTHSKGYISLLGEKNTNHVAITPFPSTSCTMGVQLLRRSRSKEGSTVSPERRQPFCLIGIKAAFRSGTSSRGEARCASSWYQVIRISIKVWMLLSSAWEIIWAFTRIKHAVRVEVFCAPNFPLTSLQLLRVIYFLSRRSDDLCKGLDYIC